MMGHCAMPTESVSDGGAQVEDSLNVRPENVSRRANTRKRKNTDKLFPSFNSTDLVPKYTIADEILSVDHSVREVVEKYGGRKRALSEFFLAVENEELRQCFFINNSLSNNESRSYSLSKKLKDLSSGLKSGEFSEPILKDNVITVTNTETSQYEIAEKAKQEAYVWQRVSELQRQGLWSEKRLPKVYEAPKGKAHWDYVLEEVQWLSTDFTQERKWKKVAAKKCAKMVQKHFQERETSAQKAARAAELHTRKVAAHMAKIIKNFWSNAEKLVEYRQQTKIEEKRKEALDQHLSFIVDQTEKFSSLVAESMNMNKVTSSERLPPVVADVEFEPYESSSDDEATIEEEEKKNIVKEKEKKEEIEMLKRESQLPIEDIIKELPEGYFNVNNNNSTNDGEGDGDESYSSETDISDDESTIIKEEQMTHSESLGGAKELAQLKADNNMSIEQLMRQYNNKSVVVNNSNSGEYDMMSDASEDVDEDVEDDEDDDNVGLSCLFENEDVKKLQNGDMSKEKDTTDKDIDDAAAIAESLQPKGNTLSSTSVVTKVPHLLKLSLREYQHIGLDWLVTMYERNLNGILADEMGLGKTIQTIALLAHLACEKEIWGPHLIIVPTSVILNWEMELKKWCPAFKIITYFGNPKERKMKRIGWTKPNTFHICITSYKLVVQDHQSFRRKKWQYLILDEAQNIKNFKSQRWQMLLNFQTERRLLLTGTPLQNNLMELWSLMHFLMPNLFASHREFKEWFSNPVTGMIEGNSEYNENIIKRLHKVLRPFLLRRLKSEVEKQLPKKFEHVVLCRLSNRQRFLYDDFMSRTKTKETLASGNLLSVINVLMQLRKVCNHPNLFETRPVISPFQMNRINYVTASIAAFCTPNFIYDPFQTVSLMNTNLIENETTLSAYVVHRTRKFSICTEKLIAQFQEYDNQVATNSLPVPPPKTKLFFRLKTPRNLSCVKLPDSVYNKDKVNSLLHSLAGKIKTETGQDHIDTTNKVIKAAPLIKALIAQGEVNNMSLKKNKLQECAKLNSNANTNNNSKVVVHNKSSTSNNGTQIVKNIFPITLKGTTANTTGHKISIANNFTRVLQGKQVFIPNSTAPSACVKTVSGQRILIRNAQSTSTSTSTTTASLNNNNVAFSSNFQVGAKSVPIIRIATMSSKRGSGSSGGHSSQSQAIPSVLNEHNITLNRQLNVKIPKLNAISITGNNDKSSYLRIVQQRRKQRRIDKITTLGYINGNRTRQLHVPYGKDVRQAMNIDETVSTIYKRHIHNMCTSLTVALLNNDNGAHGIFRTANKHIQMISDSLSEFLVCVPSVQTIGMPLLGIAHMTRDKTNILTHVERNLNNNSEIMESCNKISEIMHKMSTSFPHNRLLQYDCGKLQTLDLLLQRLKQNDHRVLIFTQMSKMLDVLEAFLTFHGHIYLRLDGSTKIEQRQLLMERFNADKRFFCFILSTRSGGVGVNLTGADTVIFYDSDWNPTMDAQAQDRCHRIGQTRDVHIYRLISEKTIEENILKKANQKRLLGDLAIEGGNFTTAYFKCSATIHDLFNVDFEENDPEKRMTDSADIPLSAQYEKSALNVYETALAAAEDEPDVAAANIAKEEAVADMEEFDEDIPLTEGEDSQVNGNGRELSKAEQELNTLLTQLSPIERWAVNFMETTDAEWAVEQLAIAEAEIEQQKREWEIERKATIKRADEQSQQLAAAEQDDLLTYSRCDANQTWISFGHDMDTVICMPIWIPLNYDMQQQQYYQDRGIRCLYKSVVMTEDQLPPVYIKKETKSLLKQLPIITNTNINNINTTQSNQPKSTTTRLVKNNNDNIIINNNNNSSSFTVYDPPCSLFDWPSTSITKLRQDMRFQKYKSMSRSSLPCTSALKSHKNQNDHNSTEQQVVWTSLEDNALLQAIKYYLDIPMNLSILYPAHQANWDFVASTVNFVCGNVKTPLQCKYRFDVLLRTRDDCNAKRIKRRKTSLPVVSTSVQQDISFTQSCMHRFSKIISIQSERKPPHKSVAFPTPWVISHNDVPVRTTNIDYSVSRSPTLVVAARQNRAYKEKQELQLQQQQIMMERSKQSSLRMVSTAKLNMAKLPEYQHQRLSLEKLLQQKPLFEKDNQITFSQSQLQEQQQSGGRKRKLTTMIGNTNENKNNTIITKREIQLQQLQHEKRIIRVHHPMTSNSTIGVPMIAPKVVTVTRCSTPISISSRVVKVDNRLMDSTRLQGQIESRQLKSITTSNANLFKNRQSTNNMINSNNRQETTTIQADSSDLSSIFANMLPYSPNNSTCTENDVDVSQATESDNDNALFNEEEIGELLRKDPSLDSIVTKFLASANVNDSITDGALEPLQIDNNSFVMPPLVNTNNYCNDISQVVNNELTRPRPTPMPPNNRFTIKQNNTAMGVRQSLIVNRGLIQSQSQSQLMQRLSSNNHSPRFRIPRVQTQQHHQSLQSANTLNRAQMPVRGNATIRVLPSLLLDQSKE